MPAVLIVDSTPSAYDPYAERLRQCGFEVTVVPTARAACSVVDDVSPEVVLAHVRPHEPSSRGIEIATYLRTQPTIEDIPLVLVTGSLEKEDASAVVAAGCDCYLRAPVPPDLLVNEVRQISDHSRRLREQCASVLARAARLRDKSDALRKKTRVLMSGEALVTTDKFGNVVRLNHAASRLLNISMRCGVGRNLLVFVGGERDRASRGLAAAVAGQRVREALTLRPRERKAVNVYVDLVATESETGDVDWTIGLDEVR